MRRRAKQEEPTAAAVDLDFADRDRALKDYKIAVEYKHLWQHAPGGVYVTPDLDDLRIWHGVIFVRRGMYANGMFKFSVELPQNYGDAGAWPRLVFMSTVFNPLVKPSNGELDLRLMMPGWNPAGGDCMLKVITYMKKIFYTKDFALAAPPNPEAQRMFRDNKSGFAERAAACVEESLSRRYESPPGSSLKFTEPRPAHDSVAARILGAQIGVPAAAGGGDAGAEAEGGDAMEA
ncbi:ubiquitin-conjugating enzyme/RWD-like protein [Tribonema minus]|uniref:Ubiquitin-conjugating enzyme/RWD-like protein n=1 Tax=Tribonema minus TaxID=303371 RepID=A0A836CDQ7_9STRA|nr:ubiquitin-conjugating enzyme/RWD-like protein [Tribonema minus]